MIDYSKLPKQTYAVARAIIKHCDINETVLIAVENETQFRYYISLWERETKRFYKIKNISYLSTAKIEITRVK